MTSTVPDRATLPAAQDITTPEQLRDLMGVTWTFSDQQFAAVTAPLEPAVVIAGAGSGKTTVMAARVVWLVATGRVAPGEVLGLTFTTKATAELQTRIRDSLRQAGLLPERGTRAPGPDGEEQEVEEPTVATYHSYASALLSEHGLRIGHEPDTRLVADASRYQLATRAVQRYAAPVEQLTDSPRHVVQYLLALDGEMSEHLVGPDEVRAHDERLRPLLVEGMATEHRKTYRALNEKAVAAIDKRAELLGLVEAYRSLKRHHGLMDFSDQIALAARLAEQCPTVGEAERAKFKVVLLDEYQDTSVAQALMLRRLFSGPDSASGQGHPVMAVGDPNQAIYGWRGASVSNILEFTREFPAAGGERGTTYPLTVNRRSDARILATANHLAADLYASRPDLLPLETAPEALPGEVRAVVHETWDDELAWLADRVLETHAGLAATKDGPCWREIGVLTRDNAHAAAVFDALSEREIPVEIVGLKGLLRLPEVSEVVATMTLVQDVTANAALLTLLAGPRWAIGPRDLALLGRRARELAGDTSGATAFEDVRAQLAAAVEGADPTEIASLCDALEDPGDLAYSPEARERFGLLAAELRRLRQAVGEPILDLVRRIVDTTGIDVELASSVSPAAAARRDNLDLFVQAVAEFQAVDGQVTLPALLAWLEAEDEFGQGLDVATPSEADSVKLLTVHRAKGLEWDAVFLVGVTERKFPTNRTRSSWLTVPSVMPTALRGDARDLPQLAGHAPEDIKALGEAVKAHEALEELRLGYVAWTRARHSLWVSAWRWAPRLKSGLGPSAYLLATREAMATWGAEPDRWADCVVKGEDNPYADRSPDLPWPISHRTAEVERRIEAARRVHGADPVTDAELAGGIEDGIEDVLELERVQQWDEEIARLLDEARRDRSPHVEVALPSSLSATSLARLRDDPDELARDLARPMPRKPSSAARFGTRFHAWVEARFGQQLLIDPDELPGRADLDIDDDADLQELIARFEEGTFAERVPHAVEPSFALVVDGQVVRGRIDAVYREDTPEGEGYLVVDWKTGRSGEADPLQLAIYRQAWAELHDVPVERVHAAFYFVRSGRLVEPADLPDRQELARLLRVADAPER
ncbi:ATP-dependent DNA helicase [Nocardioides abyssi]|uniref:DNA 3'-5' helicase n=1 Tax=Nocardioides abyssi TaxID=3058370 RepID=A0ABT8EWG5_9ACTN|nr:ATP-dependent DNA helicase [Nocardioides abyssi]MDN4162201.1 ATP-dependent DNA helicase [Nocardioides abyssi]